LTIETRIGYLGPAGTYSERAAIEMVRVNGIEEVEFIPFSTFKEGMLLLRKKEIDKAIFPAENSTDGGIVDVLKLLKDMPRGLFIEGKIIIPIEHCLLAVGKESEIEKIYSKKEIFQQCREYLNERGKRAILFEEESSAKAADKVATIFNDKTAAVIGPKWLTEKFPVLKIVKEISNNGDNATKFLMIGRSRSEITGNDETSFIFSTPNKPFEMDKVTLQLGILGINKTKIESRPFPGKRWEYIFYVDIDGHIKEERIKIAFKAIKLMTSYFKFLGSYPKAEM